MRNFIFCLVCIASLVASAASIKKNKQLQFNTQKQPLTVSGVSAGAFFATQLMVAYSSRIQGIASLAGGIYGCADGNAKKAQSVCMATPQSIDVTTYATQTQTFYNEGLIDNPQQLKTARAYIFSGKSDHVVHPEASIKLKEYFLQFMDTEQIMTNFSLAAGHSWITTDYGNACTATQPPWINKCGVDIAGEFFKFLHTDIKPAKKQVAENLIEFDQTPYNIGNAGLDKIGFIYIPENCAHGKLCRAHLSFHGCLMGAEYVQKTFAENSGLNDWAEANDIVIVYPQLLKNAELNNPNGCWDWYGYTGTNYLTQNASQMKSIYKLIQQMFQ